jgi:hypothetical protein
VMSIFCYEQDGLFSNGKVRKSGLGNLIIANVEEG